MSTKVFSAPINPLSLLLVQTQAARWKAAGPEQLTGVPRDVAKSGYLLHGFSGGMIGMCCRYYWDVHLKTVVNCHTHYAVCCYIHWGCQISLWRPFATPLEALRGLSVWRLSDRWPSMLPVSPGFSRYSLQWRHNGHNSVSNHQPHNCLLNRLFRRRSTKISKLRVTAFVGRKCFYLMASSCINFLCMLKWAIIAQFVNIYWIVYIDLSYWALC